MSQDFRSAEPIRPLSVGNVVSAGIQLYRSHLKLYFGLALRGCLWSLVPIYGWAKLATISALISRLAYSELVDQPETVQAAEQVINPKLWNFFVTALLVGSIVSSGIFGAIIIAFIILFLVLVSISWLGNTVTAVASVGLTLLGILAVLVVYVRLYSYLMVAEMPLAVEDNMDGVKTIGRSWNLAQGSVRQVQWVVAIAAIITLPFQVLLQTVFQGSSLIVGFLSEFLGRSVGSDSVAVGGLVALTFIIIFIISFLGNAAILPFWQTTKAVVYYDLRTRREGFGLKLRDRNSPPSDPRI